MPWIQVVQRLGAEEGRRFDGQSRAGLKQKSVSLKRGETEKKQGSLGHLGTEPQQAVNGHRVGEGDVHRANVEGSEEVAEEGDQLGVAVPEDAPTVSGVTKVGQVGRQ